MLSEDFSHSIADAHSCPICVERGLRHRPRNIGDLPSIGDAKQHQLQLCTSAPPQLKQTLSRPPSQARPVKRSPRHQEPQEIHFPWIQPEFAAMYAERAAIFHKQAAMKAMEAVKQNGKALEHVPLQLANGPLLSLGRWRPPVPLNVTTTVDADSTVGADANESLSCKGNGDRIGQSHSYPGAKAKKCPTSGTHHHAYRGKGLANFTTAAELKRAYYLRRIQKDAESGVANADLDWFWDQQARLEARQGQRSALRQPRV